MNILLFSDPHFGAGADLGHAPGDRLEDQVAVGKRIVEIAREHDCSLILNGGDTFEGPLVMPEHYDAFRRAFHDAPCPIVSVLGNGRHDAAKRRVPAVRVLEGGDVQGIMHPMVICEGYLADAKGVAVACLPWTPVDRLVAANGGGDRAEINRHAAALLIETAQGLRAECAERYPDLPCILFGHWCVEGAAGWQFMQASEPVLPLADLQALGFDLVAMGHVHEPAHLSEILVSDGKRWAPILSIGSPMPLNFGETGYDHGVWIYDTETCELEFVPIESRPLVEMSWNHSDDLQVYPEILHGDFSMRDEIQGAIVKVRYASLAEDAKAIDHAKLREALYAAGAHHVWKIEATVERETRARVEGIDSAVTEMEALELWITSQAIDADMAQRMRERTKSYLEAGV